MMSQHGSDTDIPFLFSEYIASILRILYYKNVIYDVINMTQTFVCRVGVVKLVASDVW